MEHARIRPTDPTAKQPQGSDRRSPSLRSIRFRDHQWRLTRARWTLVAVFSVACVRSEAAELAMEDARRWCGEPWAGRKRPAAAVVDRLVIHSTAAVRNLEKNRARPRAKWFDTDSIFSVWKHYDRIAPHYFIDRSGKIYRLNDESKSCHHAGRYTIDRSASSSPASPGTSGCAIWSRSEEQRPQISCTRMRSIRR